MKKRTRSIKGKKTRRDKGGTVNNAISKRRKKKSQKRTAWLKGRK